MIFIVARTYMCAVDIARREGLTSPSQMTWLASDSMHKLRGIQDPTIWIADCGRLSDADQDLIGSRYRTPGLGMKPVTCG